MRWLIVVASTVIFSLSGCLNNGDGAQPSAIPGDKLNANNFGHPSIETLIEQDWVAPTPMPFGDDARIAEWSVPANTSRMWVNITLESEGLGIFASNGAYQGPGEAYRDNYDQDTFNGGVARLFANNPPEGAWYGLYRHGSQEPMSEARGSITVEIERLS